MYDRQDNGCECWKVEGYRRRPKRRHCGEGPYRDIEGPLEYFETEFPEGKQYSGWCRPACGNMQVNTDCDW